MHQTDRHSLDLDMRHVVLAAALFAGACAASAPAPVSTPSSSENSFTQLDLDHQIAFMKTVVVPTMKPVFQQHDPQKFGNFGCVTCHGEDASLGDFEMPNNKLPKLDFSDLNRYDTRDLDWMQHDVRPTMARLLGLPEADAPKDGLACFTCHTGP
jgi:hypothetical protein